MKYLKGIYRCLLKPITYIDKLVYIHNQFKNIKHMSFAI